MFQSALLAQDVMPDGLLPHLINGALCAAVGLIILAISIYLMSKLMPLPFWREIEEDQNIALGIMVGSIILGISIIIAAAIHG